MPLSRAVLERQLKLAEHTLAERVKVLADAGKSGDACAADPQWRNAHATCSTIRRRLVAVAATEANNAAVIRRKSEPKPEPEPVAVKAKAKPAKEKTKSEPKAEDKDKKPKKPRPDAKAEKK